MRRILILLPLLATACSSEPMYAPPTNSEAQSAYIRAIRADLIESPPRHPAETPAAADAERPDQYAARMGRSFAAEAENSSRSNARSRIQSLDRVNVGDCSWGSIDSDDVRPGGRQRVEGAATEGYSCSYEVFHNSPVRGPVSARGTGYFFHREGSYDFGSVEEASFEEVGS